MQSSKLALPTTPLVGVTKEGRLCYKYRDGEIRELVAANPLARIAKPILENMFSKKR